MIHENVHKQVIPMKRQLMKGSFILIALLLFLLIAASKGPTNCTYTLDKEIASAQKEIVGKLSGNEPILNSTTIQSRYTEADKKMVRTYLKRLFSEASLPLEEHSYSIPNNNPKRSPKKVFNGINLYVTLPATSKTDEYILLGAHFDSVKDCPGANDNATGVALVYGVAKELSVLKNRNKNILIAFFDEEEDGLIGSTAFAEMLKDKNYNIHSVHTVDQMGWDTDGDLAIELELPTQFLKETYTTIAKEHAIPVHVTDVYSTDHQAFRREGYNAIGITEEYINKDTTPHYHKKSDTYDLSLIHI